MEIELEIDQHGDLIVPRDHEILVELVKKLNSSNNFEEFFESKPTNIFGDKNYNSFCG